MIKRPRIIWLWVALVVLGGGWLACLRPAMAAAAPAAQVAVVANEAVVDFPETVRFRLELGDGQEVVSAVLNYDVARFTCVEVAGQVPVEVEGPFVEWTWVMSRSGNPPPGSRLTWQWTVTDSSGATTTTDPQQLTFADDRFEWQTVEESGIHLHWYQGEEVGPMLLESAVEGLERLEEEMGIELQSDVNLWIYGDSEDMREAVIYIQEWAGGVAFTEYNTILIGVPPAIAESWGRPTVRHELAHLVVEQFGRSCVGGDRPTWLEEGLAVYAEGPPAANVLEDIGNAIENNSFEPVRSLNGAFPAHGEAAGIAYSQSYSLVAYLLETYGQEEMQALIQALAAGAGYDQALETVYGFNADGLEVEWRRAIGAPPREIPPTPTPLAAAAVPTYAPLDPIPFVATPESAAATAPPPAGQDGESPGVCALGLLPLALVVAGKWRRGGRRGQASDRPKVRFD
jgi:hypothetical protein